MKLVMTLKVRDEEDVLESNLRYHLAQGIDFFIVTDNGSVDRAPQILRRYQEAGVLHVIEEPARDFEHRGRAWVTRMAQMAASDFGRLGAPPRRGRVLVAGGRKPQGRLCRDRRALRDPGGPAP